MQCVTVRVVGVAGPKMKQERLDQASAGGGQGQAGDAHLPG